MPLCYDDLGMMRTQPVQRGYEPPSSVWYGEDAALLEKLISFYPRKTPKRIWTQRSIVDASGGGVHARLSDWTLNCGTGQRL